MRWRLLSIPMLMIVMSGAWIGSERLERNNDYCNSCHLSPDTPLHVEIRERFERVIPRNLAGVHGRGWLEDREDQAFRCIDCHSGSGLVERVKIKLISARDGVRYLVGAFEEPERMSFDLSAETCLRCHSRFRHSAAPGWTLQAYHGREAHDHGRADSPRCVSCHSVHEADGEPVAYFMNRERVDRQCRSCHVPSGDIEIPSLRRQSAD